MKMHVKKAQASCRRFYGESIDLLLPDIFLTKLTLSGTQLNVLIGYGYPTGNMKHVMVDFALRKALAAGVLKPGGKFVEASSGNTGIACAWYANKCGFDFTAVVPDNTSDERLALIREYGGNNVTLRFSPGNDGMNGAKALAAQIALEAGAFYLCQFANPLNPAAYRDFVVPKIAAQIPSQAVVIVSGIGTGGTLMGFTDGFRSLGCEATPIALRPVATDTADFGTSFKGVGVVDGASEMRLNEKFPDLLQWNIDEYEALKTVRELRALGYPVGLTAGLNVAGAIRAAKLFPKATIVTVLPDHMNRYPNS